MHAHHQGHAVSLRVDIPQPDVLGVIDIERELELCVVQRHPLDERHMLEQFRGNFLQETGPDLADAHLKQLLFRVQ